MFRGLGFILRQAHASSGTADHTTGTYCSRNTGFRFYAKAFSASRSEIDEGVGAKVVLFLSRSARRPFLTALAKNFRRETAVDLGFYEMYQ